MRQILKYSLHGPTLAMIAVMPALALTGCATHSKDHFVVGGTSNQTYKTRHPIVLDEKEQTLDIPVGAESFGLPRASLSAIEGYASNFKGGASGVITVMLPKGSANQRAAKHVLPQIVDAVTSRGIQRSRMRMTHYDATRHGSSAPVRLSYMAVKAGVTGCGRWDGDLAANNIENRNYTNFGCATQANLAAQLANPADLLAPRGSTPVDATRRSNVIEAYRESGNGPGMEPL